MVDPANYPDYGPRTTPDPWLLPAAEDFTAAGADGRVEWHERDAVWSPSPGWSAVVWGRSGGWRFRVDVLDARGLEFGPWPSAVEAIEAAVAEWGRIRSG